MANRPRYGFQLLRTRACFQISTTIVSWPGLGLQVTVFLFHGLFWKHAALPHASWRCAWVNRSTPFREPFQFFLGRVLRCSRWIRWTRHGCPTPSRLCIEPLASWCWARLVGLVYVKPFFRRREIPHLKRGVVRARAGTLDAFCLSLVVWCEAPCRWTQVAILQGVDDCGGHLQYKVDME